MCVGDAFVDPGLGLILQVILVEFAGGEHYLPVVVVHAVAIDVDVFEAVVQPYFLQLRVGGQQWARIPKADVVDGGLVLLDIL